MSVGFLNRDRATRVMGERGLSAIIASTPQNVKYAAGYHSHGQWLMPGAHTLAIVPADDSLPVSLVVSVGELDRVAEHPPAGGYESLYPYGYFAVDVAGSADLNNLDSTVVQLRDQEWHRNPPAAVAAALRAHGLQDGTIALDERGTLPSVRDGIREELSGTQIVDGYVPLQIIRQVKTEREIAALRRAVEVAEIALSTVVAAFHVGMTEREMMRVYENVVLDLGARPTFSHILVGARGALSNGAQSGATLGRGDVVRFDVGCTVDSYNSDIARTAVFGTVPAKVRRYYDAILEGEEAALRMTKPGVKANDLFNCAVDATRATGIEGYDRNHVGHGIGIEMYDPPIITAVDETPLEAGMVMNLETPYYELGWGGLQVEDTFVVRDDGPEMLTTLPRGLIEVD